MQDLLRVNLIVLN